MTAPNILILLRHKVTRGFMFHPLSGSTRGTSISCGTTCVLIPLFYQPADSAHQLAKIPSRLFYQLLNSDVLKVNASDTTRVEIGCRFSMISLTACINRRSFLLYPDSACNRGHENRASKIKIVLSLLLALFMPLSLASNFSCPGVSIHE